MPQTTMETLKKDFNLNDYDLNLIFAYLQLSTEKRAVIREFFENITKRGWQNWVIIVQYRQKGKGESNVLT